MPAPRSIASPRRHADFDKLAVSARLQHIDPTNDQAYSPYISTRRDGTSIPSTKAGSPRQDLNFGVNKTFHFDGDFRRVAFSGDTFAETKWAFGVTAAVQRRFRDPAPGSSGCLRPIDVVRSRRNGTSAPASTWSAAPSTRVAASIRRTGSSEPIVTLEFVLPASWFGSAANAAIVGRPAIDVQVAYEKNWSNLGAANYEVWHVGAALKARLEILMTTQSQGETAAATPGTQRLSLFALSAMVVGAWWVPAYSRCRGLLPERPARSARSSPG